MNSRTWKPGEFEAWKKAALELVPAPFTGFRLHHLPMFMSKRVVQWAKSIDEIKPKQYSRSFFVSNLLHKKLSCGFDHWGSGKFGDKPCFVSQPYDINAEILATCEQIAGDVLNFNTFASSDWYPGHTISLVFTSKEFDKPIPRGMIQL